MKTTYAVVLCILLLLVSACAQKVNDPADVQAIKKCADDFAKAVNAADANGIAALMTDKTVYADRNVPVAVGAEAARSFFQSFFDENKAELSLVVEDVRVSGDLGAARGTWTNKITPKAEGVASSNNGGTWVTTYARQRDGSWKSDWCVPSSNQPLPGTTADGAEEKALNQIEQDWANAMVKSDAAAMERFIAKEWTLNADGQVMSSAQAFAEVKAGAYKLVSMKLSDLSPYVFGDVAVVTSTVAMKGKYKGSDIAGPIRSTDFFVKRDGRWQAVSTQNITIK